MIEIDIKNVPDDPGVYKFLNAYDRVIYVGKAKNLKKRISSYHKLTKKPDFSSLNSTKTVNMLAEAKRLEWTIVSTELESLLLEYTWIKKFEPKYNIIYRDDKSYPYIAIDSGKEFPRIFVTRKRNLKNVKYFGPYAQAFEVRKTLETVQDIFGLRTCTETNYKRAKRENRPCLLGHINKCSAPCVGNISKADYEKQLKNAIRFLNGNITPAIKSLKNKMIMHSDNEEFELAGKYRDQIDTIEKLFEKNVIFFDKKINTDVFAVASDDLQLVAYVLSVRNGRIIAERRYVLDSDTYFYDEDSVADEANELSGANENSASGDSTASTTANDSKNAGPNRGKLSEIIESVIMQHYQGSLSEISSADKNIYEIPALVIVPELPDNRFELGEYLSESAGKKVEIRKPERGRMKALLDRAELNAKELLHVEKLKRLGDVTNKSLALNDLQKYLGLKNTPYRIEGYDISHTFGTYKVASMAVFEDAVPLKKHYRSFNIKSEEDDTRAIYEVITRRFKKYKNSLGEKDGENIGAETENANSLRAKEEAEKKGDEKRVLPQNLSRTANSASSKQPRKTDPSFSTKPDLLLIDGGVPQLKAAQKALNDLGINDVEICSIAKRIEEIFVPSVEDDKPNSVIFDRKSNALFLLQQVRDESHRFAITKHRNRRSKGMLENKANKTTKK